MRPFTLTLLLLSSVFSFGQTLQTYSGTYENGTATYQYYENENYERVLNGNFTYNEGTAYTIAGQFKDNLRTGLWKATTTQKNYYTKQVTTKVATATYVAGNLDGLCNYSHTDVATKKVLAKSTARFKNNVMVGNYSHVVSDDENDFTISISLNQEGFADSTSTIKYKYEGRQLEDILKYRYGFLYWELHRDMTDGRILKKLDRKKLIDEIYSNYDSTLKVSIVPYAEFARQEQLIYLSQLDKVSSRSNELAKIKNYDTVYYENAPFTFLRSGMDADYGSFWDLYIAIDFWLNGDCDYCGNRGNPLYHFPKGANTVSFQPVKELAIRDDLFSKSIEISTVAKNKKRRQQLLDSLRIAVLVSIDWVNVTDPSKTVSDYSISSMPVTKNHSIGYKDFNYNLVDNYNDDYYKQHGGVYDRNKRLEQSIDDIKNKRVVNYSYGDNYNNEPYGNTDDVVQIAKWLGLRLATDSEVNLAVSNGLIKPKPTNIDYKVYWFVK